LIEINDAKFKGQINNEINKIDVDSMDVREDDVLGVA